MNAFLKISVIILGLQSLLQAQWIQQTSGTIYAIKAIYFINENTGFACCYNSVLKTTNGGANWQTFFLQGSHNDLKFTDNLTGYICSDSGKIFKTTNAANSWLQQSSNTNSNLTAVSFLNSQTGIASGYNKTILKTVNGGGSWASISNFFEQVDILDAEMLSDSLYFLSGSDSYIILSSNAGASWILHTSGMPNPLFAIEFINQNTGWVTGCCGMFMNTTNGGHSWTNEYYLTLGFTLHALQFLNSSTGFTAGDNGGIYRTTNGGSWWDSTVTATAQTLYSIHMINPNTGWVAGGYGTILKTTNGGGTGYTIGISLVSSEVPSGFELCQNYPNPFNPSTKIKFRIPAAGYAEITVFDALGNELERLFSGNLAPAVYELDFNAAKYPSGVYFYSIKYGRYAETRKMVLLK